ncbi:DUF2020 domain-containing protein [Corynebacterium gerontici]|uniref:DUF2020 domain-containing protein n=1 Tax=Corynebacterium gerontici TaxID=2079234 RepID=A0A3G6IXV6_9CORY|nr:DUF2020 domain-containing protein [Corynebacterium gerontici]AZA10476.1 hypothetical protein CGERO_00705 [Corynebacterium gerontici]
MKRTLIACALSLAACSQTPEAPEVTQAEASKSPLAAIAPATLPELVDAPCPYLDNEFIAETNGQKVTSTGADARFDPPACGFWGYGENPQATVLVRHMPDEQQAREVVDWAAPIDSTDPASLEGGWEGGRSGGESGAVFAVQKGPTAVVVWSDQAQSLKAQLIAEQTIASLGL